MIQTIQKDSLKPEVTTLQSTLHLNDSLHFLLFIIFNSQIKPNRVALLSTNKYKAWD